jgi:branched-subunit amino acid transport protein
MSPVSTWIIIACVSATTFLMRASFIVFADPHKFPHLFRQALKFVPPAVLAAITAPGILMIGGIVDLSLTNERLIAGLVAIVATIFMRSAMTTIAVGMGTLWLLQWLGV